MSAFLASGPSPNVAVFLGHNASTASLGAGLSAGSALPNALSDLAVRAAAAAVIAAVPGLVDTLDRILSRLPRGGLDGEEPPQYGN